MFQNEIKHTILPESPLVHVQSLLQPTNTSQVGIDLMDKSRIVSLTHIDWGVTVLKQEIAAHVIWLKCQSFIEVKALWMESHRRIRAVNTNSSRRKKMAADTESVKHRAAWSSQFHSSVSLQDGAPPPRLPCGEMWGWTISVKIWHQSFGTNVKSHISQCVFLQKPIQMY